MADSIGQIKNVINALRVGVIPDVELELFDAGREKEIEEFKRCLNELKEGSGIVRLISGEYGSGETFMLSLLRQLGVKNGFIVSKIQINNGFYLNNMETLYYKIMHNLTVKLTDTQGTDFENIFNTWIDKLQNYTNKDAASSEIRNVISALNDYNSSFARALLTYIKARVSRDTGLSNAASSWIKGEKNIPASLKARFDVKGDVDKQNSMDFLKAFIKLITLTGYSGMVILIDEMELIMNTRSDIRRTAYENLRYIIDSTGAGELGRCMFVFTGTNDFFKDDIKGIKTYNALYQRLGSTSYDSPLPSFGYNTRQPVIKLCRLYFDDLQLLTKKIVSLYARAYGWSPKNSCEAIKSWVLVSLKKENHDLLNINTRNYIVKLIEILDTMEQHPDKNIYNSELRMVEQNGIITFVNGKMA
jgi:Protein of unknown function (DUF2791).